MHYRQSIIKKINLLFLPFFLMGIVNRTTAQMGMGNVEDIQQIKNRELIVVIQTPDDKVLKKLTKKGETDKLNEYQGAFDAYNTEVKEVAEKFWTFSSNKILYKTQDEVDKMKPSWDQYALLYCTTTPDESSLGVGYQKAQGLSWTLEGEDKLVSYGFTEFVVTLPEAKKNVYFQIMPDPLPTKAELVYAISFANIYFNYRMSHQKPSKNILEDMVAENQYRLKNRTLLLRDDKIEPKLTSEKISDAYPFKYKVVNSDTMDQYIMNADSSYAYTIGVLGFIGSRLTYIKYVYDCKDGSLLGLSVPDGGDWLAGGYSHENSTNITTKDLAHFWKYLADVKKQKQ